MLISQMDELFSVALPLWSALAVGSLALLYVYLTPTFEVFKKQGINGPTPVPFFGNMLPFLVKSTAEIDLEHSKRYGRVYSLFNTRSPVLIVGEPDLVKEILIKEFSCFVNRTPAKHLQRKPLNRMMTLLSDDHWRQVRSSVSPAYSSLKLKQMLTIIKGCANNLLAHVDLHSDEGINVDDVLSGYAMDAIIGTVFGIDARSLDEPNNEFYRNAKEFFLVANRRYPRRMPLIVFTNALPWLGVICRKLGIDLVDPEPVAYMENVVKKALGSNNDVAEDVQNLLHLCASKLVDTAQVSSDVVRPATVGGYWTTKGLTEDDIVSNVIVTIIAGYDTVSALLNYFCYAMATNPDVQRKVYDEIAQNFEGEEVTYEKLKDLRYLDMCLDETLRMYPPSLRLDRKCNKAVKIGKYCIPEGLTVNIPVYALHHDPDYWEDPFTFKPERFSPDGKASYHPYMYLPFGTGPRNCIGMRLSLLQAKAAIVSLFLQYEVVTCRNTPEPPLKFGATFNLLSPKKPLILAFKRRVQK